MPVKHEFFEPFVKAGGSKGMPRAMAGFYETLAAVIPEGSDFLADFIQIAVNYPSEIFTAGEPQYLSIAPWNGEIIQLAIVNQTTIVGGPSDITFKIQGSAGAVHLNTGNGTRGLVAIITPDDPYLIEKNNVLFAKSDGQATGDSSVMVFATLRSRLVL
jgi:hypothetical protein